VDSVIRARVVLRDGSVTVASETESTDLFWALRGAGQNMFGVVTQLEYQLHPSQDTQLFVTGDMPLDPHFLTSIGKKHAKAPGEFMFSLEGSVTKHGTTDAMLSWFGQDDASLDHGEAYIMEHVMPLLPKDVATSMSVDRLSWSEVTREGGNFDGNLVRAWTGFLFEENNTEKVWEQIIEKLKSVCIGNPYLIVDIELWGGEIANTKPEDTAFFYRNAVFNVGLGLLVPANMKHAEKIFRHTVRDVDKAWEHISEPLEGVYTNYIVESLSQKEYARAYWGENLERLEQLKESYDPENVFHHPQSVRPSGNQH
jgi:FAD/FMN-containing dehydrogenase